MKFLPQQYLDEVADFVLFLREKRIKQQLPDNENQERKEAMLRMIHDAKYNAPKIDSSIDVRALIDQTHDREI